MATKMRFNRVRREGAAGIKNQARSFDGKSRQLHRTPIVSVGEETFQIIQLDPESFTTFEHRRHDSTLGEASPQVLNDLVMLVRQRARQFHLPGFVSRILFIPIGRIYEESEYVDSIDLVLVLGDCFSNLSLRP